MSVFLCLSGILFGLTCQKNIVKSARIQKEIKNGWWPYKGELSIEGVFKSSGHYDYVLCLK